MRRRWLICSLLGACTPTGLPPDVETTFDEVKVCADGAVTEGIDVSVYQGGIDWAKVKAAGVDFAWIRVSDGVPAVDSKFRQNWAGARAAGVLRGAYQFFRENEDPLAQADLLLETMGPLEPDDLPPAIDVESTDGKNAAQIAANVGAWIQRVEAATGRRPIIYTGRPFWDGNVGGSTAYASYGLWIPNWGVTCPSISAAWSGWVVWQYSSTGQVGGITGAVDRDRFNGDRAALRAWIGVASPPDAGPGPRPDAPTEPDALPGAPDAPAALETDLHGGCAASGARPTPTGATGWGAALLTLALLAAARFPRRRPRDTIRAA